MGALHWEIEEEGDVYVGYLFIHHYVVGKLKMPNIKALEDRLHVINDMVMAGGMLRNNVILTGYHNSEHQGDVVLLDGEIVGLWYVDDLEWAHFAEGVASSPTLSAPSPWMLQDVIIGWLKSRGFEVGNCTEE